MTMTTPAMQCIDLDPSFAADLVPNDSANASRQLANWASFSFAVNGLTTLACVLFGVVGNTLLVVQISACKNTNQRFNNRLRLHLIALCAWNSVLLLSCFASHCVLSLTNDGLIPIRGTAAYLLFTAQPIGSMAVTAVVWQIGAITVERYLAVVHPLQEMKLKEKLPVKWIILLVSVVAVVLNIPSSALEREIIPCIIASVGDNATHPQLLQQSTSVMIILTSIKDDPVYRLWSNFVLDLIFRCPTPMFVIGIMTIRTVHCYCYNRRMRSEAFDITKQQRVHSNAAVIVLTILNAKMIICNGPYMFNTLVDLAATYASTTDDLHPSASFNQFVLSLYMTDMANLLVVVSSATDWLLFYQWHGPAGRTRSRRASVKLKAHVINRDEARVLTELATQINCEDVGCGMLLALSQHNSAIGVHFGAAHTTLDKSPALLIHGQQVGKFIVNLMTRFADKRTNLIEMRDMCRKVGAVHRKKKITMKANDVKLAKSFLTNLILSHASDPEIAQPCVTKLLSFMLHEIRAGALCEQADETKMAFVRQIVIAPDPMLLKNWSPSTKQSSTQPLLSGAKEDD